MKKLLLAAVAVMITAFSANAQVKISSPHPDLDIKITRCAYTSGTVIIDMVITNFGIDERIDMTSHSGYAKEYISMYDDEGNSYNAINSKIELGFPNKGLKGSIDDVFPQDIPLKVRLQMGGISANATKFSLLKISLRSSGAMSLSADKPVIIRNLEWAK